jgi:hypothetical protein
VVCDLLVVRVSAVGEQESRELGMPGKGGRAIERGTEIGPRVGLRVTETGVRVGTGLQQRACGVDEVALRPVRCVQERREAQVGQRVPLERPTKAYRCRRVRGKGCADGGRIAECRGEVQGRRRIACKSAQRFQGPRPRRAAIAVAGRGDRAEDRVSGAGERGVTT